MGHSCLNHFHLIISPSTISIFHHHFFTLHITKKNHIHQPISCTHHLIILQLHFSTHSSYHSSTPFFHPFILSFFISIFLHIHIIKKKILIIHFSPSYHHHLNYAPRSLIENRLGKNIVSIN